ncbi:MAG: ABC transporter permease [Chitinispirillaceae bacterium]|jgi:putative ABC transport system permease protein|nr:ABC transporter permease [Chitinispirillaceae bacterium]
MRFGNILAIAVRSLSRNKMRSFLTMLGVIIGVAAVIAMLAIGQGARDMINAQIASLGTNVIMVFPGAASPGGVRMEAGSSSRLSESDVSAIIKSCPSVRFVSPLARTSAQVKTGNQNWRTSVYGTYPSYLDIRDLQLADGVNFTDANERSATKICLIGRTVAENLFATGADATGQIIRIRNLPFKVIGVLAPKGQNAMGQDQDDIILAPFSTVQKKLMGITFVNSLIASAVSEQQIDAARMEINEALMTRRRQAAGDGTDYTIRTQTDIGTAAEATSRTLSILLASIAGVSLLVGGIGIMNIMLVSVTERTREIGIRMAVGARGRDVLLQFLVEALVMSFTGGIIGIAAGVAFSMLISKLQGWPVTISPVSILLGFGFSAAIGVFFGWYPARKAAALKPIEALRYE